MRLLPLTVSVLSVSMMLAAAPVEAACWSRAAAEAARINHFQTKLMVSALRCRTGASDFMELYNNFIRTSRIELAAINGELRGQFTAHYGARGGMAEFDRRGVQLANRYGAGDARDCAEQHAIAVDAATRKHTRASLIALADRSRIGDDLPDGACGLSVAAR